LHLDGDIYEDWMETTGSPHHFQHLQHHLQQQQQTQEGLQATRLYIERVETHPSFIVFIPLELQVLISKLGSTAGHPFEFGLGSRLV